MKRFILFSVITTLSLTACSTYPTIQQLPFDAGEETINSPAADMEPQIGSRYIVFSSDRRRRQDIYLYDIVERRLLDLPELNSFDAIASHPSISQDGRYIVFATVRQGRSGIALYDRQTRLLRNLTANLQAEVRNPTINGDGTIIAFETSVNGQWDILVYDRYGKPLGVPTDPR
ncbi:MULTISPECIES: TolB family protein [Aerosakkonema]|uniref:TolB family protein n=1 Tax=Aerosakkonema TaxID=1246629 RepID=UPI0035BA9A64